MQKHVTQLIAHSFRFTVIHLSKMLRNVSFVSRIAIFFIILKFNIIYEIIKFKEKYL